MLSPFYETQAGRINNLPTFIRLEITIANQTQFVENFKCFLKFNAIYKEAAEYNLTS